VLDQAQPKWLLYASYAVPVLLFYIFLVHPMYARYRRQRDRSGAPAAARLAIGLTAHRSLGERAANLKGRLVAVLSGAMAWLWDLRSKLRPARQMPTPPSDEPAVVAPIPPVAGKTKAKKTEIKMTGSATAASPPKAVGAKDGGLLRQRTNSVQAPAAATAVAQSAPPQSPAIDVVQTSREKSKPPLLPPLEPPPLPPLQPQPLPVVHQSPPPPPKPLPPPPSLPHSQPMPQPLPPPPQQLAFECVVCLDLPPVCALLPCGHLALCLACAEKVMAGSRACPTCRAGATAFLRVYT
jgi:hypothetical protein